MVRIFSPASRRVIARGRRSFINITLICALGLFTALGTTPANSRVDYEPIHITVDQPTLIPGEPLPVQVDLDGAGSANVTVYSNPPGAVSYQGTLQSGDTVLASTNASLPASTVVTVYAETTGQTVVHTKVAVPAGSQDPIVLP